MARGSLLCCWLLLVACRPEPTTPPPEAAVAPEPSLGVVADAQPSEPAIEAEPSETTRAAEASRDVDPEVLLQPLPKTTAAIVGKVAIPMADFNAVYDRKVAKYHSRGREIPATADARYRRSIVERLIYAEVLRQERAKRGVTIDKAGLDRREQQSRRGIRDFEKHLERRGETRASLRAMYESEFIEQALLEQRGVLEPSPEEIEIDYQKIRGNWTSDKERLRASHILFPVSEGGLSNEAAKKKAQKVYKLARAKGADFAALAREHSTGPSSPKGGDIGIFTEDRMAEEFSKRAMTLKVGGVSKPVRTKFGWHVIKLTGRWPAGPLPRSALEDQIVNRIRQRKLHVGRRELKDELLERYEVEDFVSPTALAPRTRKTSP